MAEENQDNLTLQDKIVQVDSILKQYVESLGLPTAQVDSSVSRYISLSDEQLRKLSAEESLEGSFVLARAAYFVQLDINKHTARLNWATRTIDFTIANKIGQYGQYMPFDLKRMAAIKDNDYCKKLNEVVVRAQGRIDAISYLPAQLKAMADKLEEIGKTKRNQK